MKEYPLTEFLVLEKVQYFSLTDDGKEYSCLFLHKVLLCFLYLLVLLFLCVFKKSLDIEKTESKECFGGLYQTFSYLGNHLYLAFFDPVLLLLYLSSVILFLGKLLFLFHLTH